MDDACIAPGVGCPGRCIARCEDAANLRLTAQALCAQLAEREGHAASLADCINQALREAGGLDHLQVTNYLGDMRPAVEQLSFRIGQQAGSLAEREGEITRLQGAVKHEAEWREHHTVWHEHYKQLAREYLAKYDDALARLARLREALEKYGVHKFGCKNLGKTQGSGLSAFVITDPEPCDCGLDDALARRTE